MTLQWVITRSECSGPMAMAGQVLDVVLGELPDAELATLCELAAACLQQDGYKRPRMSQVAAVLRQIADCHHGEDLLGPLHVTNTFFKRCCLCQITVKRIEVSAGNSVSVAGEKGMTKERKAALGRVLARCMPHLNLPACALRRGLCFVCVRHTASLPGSLLPAVPGAHSRIRRAAGDMVGPAPETPPQSDSGRQPANVTPTSSGEVRLTACRVAAASVWTAAL